MPRDYRPADHLAWQKIGGETVIIDLHSNQAFCLDEGGAAVWEAIEGRCGGESLFDWAASSAVENAREAVSAFVDWLASSRLIVDDGLEAPARGLRRMPVRPLASIPGVVWVDSIRSFGLSCMRIDPFDPSCSPSVRL